MKTLWFAPHPDRYSVLRESYAHKSGEMESMVAIVSLILANAILWLGVLALDLNWIWKGWVMP